MVLADLGRKINSALRSLSNAVVINEEASKRAYVCCPFHTRTIVLFTRSGSVCNIIVGEPFTEKDIVYHMHNCNNCVGTESLNVLTWHWKY